MKRFPKPQSTIPKPYITCPNCPASSSSVISEDTHDPDTGDFMFSDWWCSDCGYIDDEDGFTSYMLIDMYIRKMHVTKPKIYYS